jgi:hypothetical protein
LYGNDSGIVGASNHEVAEMAISDHVDSDQAMLDVLRSVPGWNLDPRLEQASYIQNGLSVGYKICHEQYPFCPAVSIVFNDTAFDIIDGSERLRCDAREFAKNALQALCGVGWTEHQLIAVK